MGEISASFLAIRYSVSKINQKPRINFGFGFIEE